MQNAACHRWQCGACKDEKTAGGAESANHMGQHKDNAEAANQDQCNAVNKGVQRT